MDVIDHDGETGLELTSRTITHPSGASATKYEVWQTINGKRLPIGNGDHSDLASARERYQERLLHLREQTQ